MAFTADAHEALARAATEVRKTEGVRYTMWYFLFMAVVMALLEIADAVRSVGDR